MSSSLVAHTEIPEEMAKKKKFQQNQLLLLPKCSFYFNKDKGYSHLMFSFTGKEDTSVWKIESAFHNLTPPTSAESCDVNVVC